MKLNTAVTTSINCLIENLPCGRKGVDWLIKNVWLEDFSSLLCDTLSKVLVVDVDTRDITLVARDHCSFALVGALSKKSTLTQYGKD